MRQPSLRFFVVVLVLVLVVVVARLSAVRQRGCTPSRGHGRLLLLDPREPRFLSPRGVVLHLVAQRLPELAHDVLARDVAPIVEGLDLLDVRRRPSRHGLRAAGAHGVDGGLRVVLAHVRADALVVHAVDDWVANTVLELLVAPEERRAGVARAAALRATVRIGGLAAQQDRHVAAVMQRPPSADAGRRASAGTVHRRPLRRAAGCGDAGAARVVGGAQAARRREGARRLGHGRRGKLPPPLPARSPLPAARSPLRCSVSEEELGRWPAAPRFCSHTARAR